MYMPTKMRSKEDSVLGLFFNTPKQWHFDELAVRSGLSRDRLNYWLKSFVKQGMVKKVKMKGKMPHYVGCYDNPDFQHRKRLFALRMLTESGLLSRLSALQGVKVAVVFGSFSMADWYDHSDVDVFIYGDDSEFDRLKYGSKLHREIQVHTAKNKKDIRRMGRMLPYIVGGDFVKGSITDLGVKVEA